MLQQAERWIASACAFTPGAIRPIRPAKKRGGQAFAFSRQICPRDASVSRPSKEEGAGSAGCSSHPQPCVQVKKARKQVTTGTPKQSGAPCAMVYGLFRALPGVPGLIASVACPACRTRRADIANLADLIPASGNRDHAALLVRAGFARLATPSRPSHPVPTFVAIGQTPLLTGSGMGGSNHLFLKNGSE
jgi:hypothetical protein